MYGDLGLKLVQHAKRAQNLPNLPPYQTELVRSITRECRYLNKETDELQEQWAELGRERAQELGIEVNIYLTGVLLGRNKRCLMAYHRQRADKIEELLWSGVDVTEAVGNAHDDRRNPVGGEEDGVGSVGKSSLAPEEEDYARQYNDLLAAYKGKWTDVDLTGSLKPPKDLFIDVRVLKDAGEIQTEYGALTLTKNSQFYVRQGDVERLIQQGFLQKLN